MKTRSIEQLHSTPAVVVAANAAAEANTAHVEACQSHKEASRVFREARGLTDPNIAREGSVDPLARLSAFQRLPRLEAELAVAEAAAIRASKTAEQAREAHRDALASVFEPAIGDLVVALDRKLADASPIAIELSALEAHLHYATSRPFEPCTWMELLPSASGRETLIDAWRARMRQRGYLK